ncbi:hypothetical protein F4703DRAFT_1849649 [Phycomyces blakesleeanus]
MFSNLTAFVLCILVIIGGLVNPSAGAPHLVTRDTGCQGVDVLYPSASTVVHRSEEQTIYLILGSRIENASLSEISIVRKEDEKTLSMVVWTSDEKDQMSKITAIQQDLNRLNTTLPNHFWFR